MARPWLRPDALEALPPSLVVRDLRDDGPQRGFRARQITGVPTWREAERSPEADVAARYWQRWEAEPPLAPCKTTRQMHVRHGTTGLGGLKARLGCAILSTLGRLVILPSATPQQGGVARLSFLEALRWLGPPDTGVPVAALGVNPTRPHRVEPQGSKRRPQAYPCMTKPRLVLRQAYMQQTHGD